LFILQPDVLTRYIVLPVKLWE